MLTPEEYAVIDCETTLRCPVGNNKAHPAWKDNYAVYIGVRTRGWNNIFKCIGTEHHHFNTATLPRIWVGHNIKFDLLYLMKLRGVELPSDLQIWDTQVAEYVLSGQRTQYARLDDLSIKYGGTVKDDRLKAFFAKGVGSEDIPEHIITPYLRGDIENTEKVFLAQVEQAAIEGQLGLIMAMNDALLCTTVMQHHGMALDIPYIEHHMDHLQAAKDRVHADIVDSINITMPSGTPPEVEATLREYTSNKALSILFFGGVVKYTRREKVGVLKNGKDKLKNVEYEHHFVPRLDPVVYGSEANKLGYYTTDDKVLGKIAASTYKLRTIAESIRKYRDIDKQLTTYFTRLKELSINGYVYPNLNHCSTITGRLSSTEPNLQNQTNGPIKGAFVSRFGDDGVLLDIDYNQLEMVGLAYVTQCKQLTEDLNNGVDMHSVLFNEMYDRLPTKDERKPFKSRSFQLVYGAGAPAIAESAGCSLAEAKEFINTFYSRYVGVAAFHKSITDVAECSAVPTTKMLGGVQCKEYVLKSKTGRKYVFHTYLNDRRDYKTGKVEKKMTFSPTELKNYPIQGFSTGDIVPLVLGKIVRWWLNQSAEMRTHIVPIITVHDSIVFDVHKDWLGIAQDEIPKLMVDVKNHLKDLDIHDWSIKIRVGVSVGSNWYDCKEVDVVASS